MGSALRSSPHVVRRPDPSDGRPIAMADPGETSRIDGYALLGLVENAARTPAEDELELAIGTGANPRYEARHAHTVRRTPAEGVEIDSDPDFAETVVLGPSADALAALLDEPAVAATPAVVAPAVVAEAAPEPASPAVAPAPASTVPSRLHSLLLGVTIGAAILGSVWLIAQT